MSYVCLKPRRVWIIVRHELDNYIKRACSRVERNPPQPTTSKEHIDKSHTQSTPTTPQLPQAPLSVHKHEVHHCHFHARHGRYYRGYSSQRSRSSLGQRWWWRRRWLHLRQQPAAGLLRKCSQPDMPRRCSWRKLQWRFILL